MARSSSPRATPSAPGDFYVLIPPRDDIHWVRTTSTETSVSIHLLTNDTGCVWRHRYDPGYGEERAFRSGYVNVAYEDDDGSGDERQDPGSFPNRPALQRSL
jgi:predicted metal-dependent enzyme (double-stranded beta helix superfamily)